MQIEIKEREKFIKFCRQAKSNLKRQRADRIIKVKCADNRMHLSYTADDVKSRLSLSVASKKYLITFFNPEEILKNVKKSKESLTIEYRNSREAFVFDKQIIMPAYMKGRK